MVGAAAAAIGPLLMLIGSLVSAISALIPVIGAVAGALSIPLIVIIAAVAAAIFLLYKAWTENWGGIREKVAAVIAFIKPLFEQFIQGLVNLWVNVLWPAIQKVWQWMSTVLFPYFQALGNFLGAVFGLAVRVLAGIWQNVLWPALKTFIEWASKNIMPVLKPIADFLSKVFKAAIEGISAAIKTLTGWLKTLTDKLNSVKLPAWMTPGSPTPWELGLIGVDKALKSLSNAALPNLSASMNMMPAPAVAGGMSYGSGMGGGSVQFVYSPMISTADAFEAQRVLGPFIEGKMREMQKR